MDYVDRLFAWFRHLIVKCEKQKHRLLIFFVIIHVPLIIKIILKKHTHSVA